MSFDAGSSRPRAGAATRRPARHLPLRQGLLALVLCASVVLYFGALWAAGLKLRQMLRR